LDLLTYSIYIFVSLTRLFLNLYTAHSDVGGTTLMKTHVGYACMHICRPGIIERLALMTSTIYSPSRQIKNLSLAWKVKTKERGNRRGRPLLPIFRNLRRPTVRLYRCGILKLLRSPLAYVARA
jgi:hypothetical protein